MPTMAALTKPRNTPRRVDDEYDYPLAAGAKIFAGSLVMTKDLEHVMPAAPILDDEEALVIGVATQTVDNSDGADGDKRITLCRQGAFLFPGTPTSGGRFHALDDQTLTGNSDNGESDTAKRKYPYVG